MNPQCLFKDPFLSQDAVGYRNIDPLQDTAREEAEIFERVTPKRYRNIDPLQDTASDIHMARYWLVGRGYRNIDPLQDTASEELPERLHFLAELQEH